jgi:excisionase family DNA binding protein
MGEDDWLTLVEAAGLLGLSVRTLDRWIRAGRLRGAVSENGKLLLSRQQIEEMVRGQQGHA